MNAVNQGHPIGREEVMAYLDGELRADEATRVSAHLRECGTCAALASQLRAVSGEMAKWEVEEAPARLTEKVMAMGEAAAALGVMQGADVREAREAKERGARGGFGRVVDIVGRMREKFVPLRGRWGWATAGVVAVALVVLVGVPATLHRAGRSAETVEVNMPMEGVPQTYTENTLEATNESNTPAPAPPAGIVGGRVNGGSGGGNAPAARDSKDLQLYSKLQAAPNVSSNLGINGNAQQPMIAKTATLQLSVKDFAPVEERVKAIVKKYGGYIGELNTSTPQDAARNLTATLRIPSGQMEAAIADLKALGHVDGEQESGEEVTKEFVDRDARIKNSEQTEQRLLAVLRDHTGKVKDILEAEQEIARVRGEIEQMQADQRELTTRVNFATVQLSVAEEYKAKLNGTVPPSTGRRLWNAAVEGYRAAVESVVGLGIWALQSGPVLVLWVAALFVPARWMWKRGRRAWQEAQPRSAN